MYYYFSAITPAYLKLGGACFGKISESVRAVKTEDSPLVEVISLSGVTESFNFILEESVLSSPPPFLSVTDMQGGYLIKILNYPKVSGFKVFAQERVYGALITVFSENGYKVSLDSPNGFLLDEITASGFEGVNIIPLSLSNAQLFAVVFKTERPLIYVYDKTLKKLFEDFVDDYSFSGGFFTETHLKDIAGHKIKTAWDLADGKLFAKNKDISREKRVNSAFLPEKILPFAFLEELSVGGKSDEFLSEGLIDREQDVKEFFGDFIGVTTPPSFRSPDEVGIVYRTGERTYKVEYATFSIENRKITNFKIT